MLTIFLIFPLLISSCGKLNQSTNTASKEEFTPKGEVKEADPVKDIVLGAEQYEQYVTFLKGKTIAMVVNQTSRIPIPASADKTKTVHLVDFLKGKGMDIKTIFAPEHGFRGTADAGEKIKDGKDAKTGIPVISLYGKKKKPIPSDLKGIDLILFDIQDVGARFYTYISSMHNVMEACAENGIQFLVLDRPNPNGYYVDGPVLDPAFKSFVGMHPVPVVHGMTIAEYAKMINGEGWLKDGIQCDLQYVPCLYYNHDRIYELPEKPSPNLPNARSIYLYPSLCFFEGTYMSVGRGTDKQFQIFGHPKYPTGDFEFTPVSGPGSKYPKHENTKCLGHDLRDISLERIRGWKELNLQMLINSYQKMPDQLDFFNENKFFDKLAGTDQLRMQIEDGIPYPEIRESWQPGLDAFKVIRKKYLLYD